MFCVCEAIPVAWARTFMLKTSLVQIHVVAPQEGLSIKQLAWYEFKNEEIWRPTEKGEQEQDERYRNRHWT